MKIPAIPPKTNVIAVKYKVNLVANISWINIVLNWDSVISINICNILIINLKIFYNQLNSKMYLILSSKLKPLKRKVWLKL